MIKESNLLNQEKEISFSWNGKVGKVICSFIMKPYKIIDNEDDISYIADFISFSKCRLVNDNNRISNDNIYTNINKLPVALKLEIDGLTKKQVPIPHIALENNLLIYIECPDEK